MSCWSRQKTLLLLDVHEVIHRPDRVLEVSAIGPEELGAQKFHVPADAGDAYLIVNHRANRASHVRAMGITVDGVIHPKSPSS